MSRPEIIDIFYTDNRVKSLLLKSPSGNIIEILFDTHGEYKEVR